MYYHVVIMKTKRQCQAKAYLVCPDASTVSGSTQRIPLRDNIAGAEEIDLDRQSPSVCAGFGRLHSAILEAASRRREDWLAVEPGNIPMNGVKGSGVSEGGSPAKAIEADAQAGASYVLLHTVIDRELYISFVCHGSSTQSRKSIGEVWSEWISTMSTRYSPGAFAVRSPPKESCTWRLPASTTCGREMGNQTVYTHLYLLSRHDTVSEDEHT